jgi:hypothetical protein
MNVNKRDRHRELEVYLTTFNGEQHLRLHGWLKRNDVLVKAENIQDNGDQFGVFMVYITENQLNKLKENNLESDLFMDLEVMSTESERWNLFQNIKKKEQEDMFDDIQKFLIQANETSLSLFKKSNYFVDDYIKTKEISAKDKIKDLDLMIEHFVEEERYEDCALLVKIKDKVKKYYKKVK